MEMHVSISSRLTIFWDGDTWKFQELPDKPAALYFSSLPDRTWNLGCWSIFEESGEGETGTRGKISPKKEENQQLTQLPSTPGQYSPGGDSAYESGGDARRIA